MTADVTYAAGEGPFKTKGTVYRTLLESADARVPGGREAVLSRIDDPALARFFAQPFLAASTYDIFPIVPFGMIGARLLGVPAGATGVSPVSCAAARRSPRGAICVESTRFSSSSRRPSWS